MPLPTRILFLDFDGVLLTLRTTLVSNALGFSSALPDPVTCAAIERVCRTGVHIVVSSTWRETPRWLTKLDQAGLMDFIHPTDPITPVNDASRAVQITAWLTRHPEVTAYRIIDDDDHAWTALQRPHWIQCHPHDGLMGTEMADLYEWAGLTGSNKSTWPQIAPRPHLTPAPDSEL